MKEKATDTPDRIIGESTMDINKYSPKFKLGKRNLLRLADFSAEEIFELLYAAKVFKKKFKVGENSPVLRGKTVALLFGNASTRTRVSFEIGIRQLGGDYLFLPKNETQLVRGESIRDTAVMLGRYGLSAIVLRALVLGAIANAAVTLFVIMLPRTAVFDIIRTAVMTAIGIAAVVLLGVYAGFGNLFDYLGTVGFAGVALIQLIYAIVVAAVLHARKAKAKAAAESPFIVGTNDQMAIRGLEAPAAEPAAQPEVSEPAPAAATEAKEAAQANAAFEDAAQISIEDIAEQKAEEPASENADYADAIRETPAEEVQEEPSFDYEQAKYDGKFNRAYADFAQQQEQQAQAGPQGTETRQTPNYGAQQPYYGNGYAAQQPYAQQSQQPPYQQPYAQQPAYGQQPYYANNYIPDAFFSSLTPAEKDEFDRLFISRIYGDNKRLPAYRIGGDNREFFTKVFVFMGRYRNVISDGLLEKIYNYSNSIR